MLFQLSHAVLFLANSSDEVINIPVTCFPILPVGSLVSLQITDTAAFEDCPIMGYQAHNRFGTSIEIDLKGPFNDEMRDEDSDKIWDQIASVCVQDSNGNGKLVYPYTVDFGVQYP